jgi:hypothetical protein
MCKHEDSVLWLSSKMAAIELIENDVLGAKVEENGVTELKD